MKLFKPLKHKTAEERPERGFIRRRGCLPAVVVLGAAALLYYGAVWLVVERVRTMPEGPPAEDRTFYRPHTEQMKQIEQNKQEE